MRRLSKPILAACVVAAFVFTSCKQNPDSGAPAGDQGTNSGTGGSSATTTAEPDNTGRNKRDRSEATLTPGDQGASEADRETTRKIRQAITSNDQLSANAKNIKIITVDGKVTLRGPVDSAEELHTIQSIVRETGVGSLENQLEVKSPNQQ